MRGKYKVAIVGSSGLVGRTVLKVLEERNLSNITYTPYFDIFFLNKFFESLEIKANFFVNFFSFSVAFCSVLWYTSSIIINRRI